MSLLVANRRVASQSTISLLYGRADEWLRQRHYFGKRWRALEGISKDQPIQQLQHVCIGYRVSLLIVLIPVIWGNECNISDNCFMIHDQCWLMLLWWIYGMQRAKGLKFEACGIRHVMRRGTRTSIKHGWAFVTWNDVQIPRTLPLVCVLWNGRSSTRTQRLSLWTKKTGTPLSPSANHCFTAPMIEPHSTKDRTHQKCINTATLTTHCLMWGAQTQSASLACDIT